jgi:DNA polymerase III alpha subunit
MAFVKIEDMDANIEILIFPKTLEKLTDILYPDKVVAVDGFVSYKDGMAKILAENFVEISEENPAPKFEVRGRKKQWGDKKNDGGSSQSTTNYNQSSATDYNLKPTSVVISIPALCDRDLLLQLKNILSQYPGECQAYLRLPDENGAVNVKKIKNIIEINPVSQRKIEELIGKENLELKYS